MQHGHDSACYLWTSTSGEVVDGIALGVGATLREVVARIHAGSSSAFLVKIMVRMMVMVMMMMMMVKIMVRMGVMVVLVERMAMLK